MNTHSTILLNHFPDFKQDGFDLEKHYNSFKNNNVIINAATNDISYMEHWGALSLKCTIEGKEFYHVNNRSYAVEPKRFLLLNEGTLYSSHIHSKERVESFTLHFCDSFVQKFLSSITLDAKMNIDTQEEQKNKFIATEKLYSFSPQLNSLIQSLYSLIRDSKNNHPQIEEIYYKILFEVFLQEKHVYNEMLRVNAIKEITRKELYKRLHYAKDYIESCYNQNIELSTLARITFMNEAYFLRQFKKLFQITPRQYLIKKRVQVAASLLENNSQSITEICHEVGYSDLTSFGKLFKQYYHSTPESFRNRKMTQV